MTCPAGGLASGSGKRVSRGLALWCGPGPAEVTNRARGKVESGKLKRENLGGDDAADACRYLVATKGRELRLRKLRGLLRSGGKGSKFVKGLHCVLRKIGYGYYGFDLAFRWLFSLSPSSFG